MLYYDCILKHNGEQYDTWIMNIKNELYAGDLYDGSQKESVILDMTYDRMYDVF